MSENYKDPSIKLFGKMIQLGSNSNEDFVVTSKIVPFSAATDDFEDDSSSGQNFLCSKQDKIRLNKEDTTEDEAIDSKQEEQEPSSNSVLEDPKTPATPSTDTENPKTHTKDSLCSSLSDQTSNNSDSQDQNLLKKPDKILPCARCNSMDTKFCYYNNYNVNQPRHFCKKCQRYWTAGGSMRNVPVGAGRRKSKNYAASQHRHLLIPGAPDGAVLAFGMDNSSLPNHSKAPQNFLTNNGFFRSEDEKKNSIPMSNQGNCKEGGTMESSQTVVQCFPYSWSPMPWQPGFPMSFYSTSSPQFAENFSAGPCNLQWLPTPSLNSEQSSTTSSQNNSTILGKHSREGTTLMPSNTDNNDFSTEKEFEYSRVVMPKTLRINDPLEASKSSIWTTLGIKNNNQNVSSSIGRVAFFGGSELAKGVNIDYQRNNIAGGVEASSMVLQANPAAFSRSLAFHEIAL